MTPIRIRTTIQSDTIHLPQLRSWLGRKVEIIVIDDAAASLVVPGTGAWDKVEGELEGLADYDFDAPKEQDACDIRRAGDHLP